MYGMVSLFVLADDFTGAHEAGALLAAAGIACQLWPHWEALPASAALHPAVVVNTETRHAPPDAARQIVSRLVRQALDAGARYIFKKTDSTLRGPLGAELGAMVEVCDAPVFYIPAYPAMGRTVRQGILRVHGVPLCETAFRHDARQPAFSSSVPAVVSATCSSRVIPAPRPGDDPGIPSVDSPAVLILDAETDDDLHRIALRLRAEARLEFTAGPAGVLAALLPLMELPRSEPSPLPSVERVLIVSGSLHPASRAQVAVMVAAGIPRLRLPLTGPLTLPAAETGTLILESPPPSSALTAEAAHRNAIQLASAARASFCEREFQALLAFGGDTAIALLDAFEISLLLPLGELARGVAFSRAAAARGGLLFASKAGGFGAGSLGLELLARLTDRRPQ